MEWIIVTDSGCDLLPGELAPNVHLRRVPLSILLGEEEWVDGADMDRERFLTAMEAYKGKSSSACPSPETWARAFSEGDHVIAITITGGLSGSYNSALLGRDLLWEKQPHKPVYVLDSRSAGAEIALLVFRACELIARGLPFEQVTQQLWLYHQHTHLLFLLEHVDNFVKNGRLNKLVAATIGMLGVRILGCASEHGTLQPLMKPRGAARGLDLLVRELERAGYLVTVAGKGSFVAQQNLELVREAHLAEIEGHLRTAAELARRCQISQAELEEMLRLQWEEEP